MINVSFKKEVGKFLVLFLILYCIVFIILNITGWLIKPKPLEVPSEVIESGQAAPQKKEESEAEALACIFSEKPNSILIPKIGIEAPIVFPESEDKDVLAQALDAGVVHHPSYSLPGKEGQTILLGHSAPTGWPKIRYDWVFSDLKELEAEDEVFIFFENCQYSYKVLESFFLERGEDLPNGLTNSKNMLILISCWPPGKDIRRIAVRAAINENKK